MKTPRKQSAFTLSISREEHFTDEAKTYNLMCGSCRADALEPKQIEEILLGIAP